MGQPNERMVMMVSKKVVQDKEIVVMKTKVLMTRLWIRIRMGTKLQNGMVANGPYVPSTSTAQPVHSSEMTHGQTTTMSCKTDSGPHLILPKSSSTHPSGNYGLISCPHQTPSSSTLKNHS